MSSRGATHYLAFCVICILILKQVNTIVYEPYMDEPFHIPQAQAYCRGEYTTWDPKITTPPGLYVMSLVLKKIFAFKCNLPMLRLTTMLTLLTLPIPLTRLLCFHQRTRPPPSVMTPTPDGVVLAAFPIAWFFGFLYYTDVPSLWFVLSTIATATEGRHWLAALLGLVSCTFRQTNIVWVLYAYAASQLTHLRFKRALPGDQDPVVKLHDPPALDASPGDFVEGLWSIPRVVPVILQNATPYTLVLALFGAFVVWNGGIALGDKSNHVPSLHVPQLYYFVAAATLFGWPALVSGESSGGGVRRLACDVRARMFGTGRRIAATAFISAVMAVTVKYLTIHHPFLQSDNRHYTFYAWRRIYMLHPLVPYALIPAYIACAWAWFLRVGTDQTLFQTLILPVLAMFTLLPTPLLEPRYFLIPYMLLRAQIVDVSTWGLVLEMVWYCSINAVTMWMFLYKEREGVGRFMW